MLLLLPLMDLLLKDLSKLLSRFDGQGKGMGATHKFLYFDDVQIVECHGED